MDFAMAEETGEDVVGSNQRSCKKKRKKKMKKMSAPKMACRSRCAPGPMLMNTEIDNDLVLRSEAISTQLYQNPEQTREYEETYFFQVPWVEQSPSLVPVSKFWN
eukprot:344588_1